MTSFLRHLHPPRVSERSLGVTATYGLGIVTVTLLLLLTGTGVLLMVYYVPTTAEAYASMQDLEYAVVFGSFVRALHRWTAHGMVAAVVLHLVRVGAMSAYRHRERNWFYGLSLLVLTLGLAFTGYLLPWDQLSYWAVRVTASMLDNVPVVGWWLKSLMLGGDQIGQATLTRFYMLHIALLPGLLFLMVALHLWRVRKDGGLAVCDGMAARSTVPAWPHLILRELVVFLVTTAVFCLLARLFAAPLGAHPDFHVSSNPEKAPWYFLGVQEMVSYSAFVGGVVFPMVLFGGLVALPFGDRDDQGMGQWFAHAKGRQVVLASAIVSILAWVGLARVQLRDAASNSDLFNPATGMLLLALVMSLAVGFLTRSVKEAFYSWFTVMAVAMVGFTVMGLCRGPNWIFYWPWQGWPIVS